MSDTLLELLVISEVTHVVVSEVRLVCEVAVEDDAVDALAVETDVWLVAVEELVRLVRLVVLGLDKVLPLEAVTLDGVEADVWLVVDVLLLVRVLRVDGVLTLVRVEALCVLTEVKVLGDWVLAEVRLEALWVLGLLKVDGD